MILAVFFLLIVKHFVCDFALQGRFPQTHDKHLLTSRKGHLHATDHAMGTALVFLFASSWALAQGQTIFTTIVVFAVLDYVLHFTIDWLKNNFVRENGWKQSGRPFWILTSIDQCMHTVCYLLYVILFDIYFF